jgi:hypothetical protein
LLQNALKSCKSAGLVHDVEPESCGGVEERCGELAEAGFAESQIALTVPAQNVNHYGLASAAVALAVFTIMKMNEHGVVTSLRFILFVNQAKARESYPAAQYARGANLLSSAAHY